MSKGSSTKNPEGNSQHFRARLIRLAKEELPRLVGQSYTDAVTACLSVTEKDSDATTRKKLCWKLKPEDLSWSARWASIAIREQLVDIQKQIPVLPDPVQDAGTKERNQLVPIASTQYHTQMPSGTIEGGRYKVGIVGAGAAGLFTGLIFDHLKEVYGLDVKYEILESNDNKRLGGRLYTHYFNDPREHPHDYYDVGAMRFPDTKVMSRVFALFTELQMQEKELTKDNQAGDLVLYYLNSANTTELFNDILVKNPTKDSESTAATFKVTGLPPRQTTQKPSEIIQAQLDELKKTLQVDPEKGWKDFIEKADKLDFDTTEWLETGTAWYDEALTEMVLEDLNFSGEHKWYCVMGGSQEIAKRMLAKLEEKHQDRVLFGKKVTKIDRLHGPSRNGPHHDQDLPQLAVEVAGESQARVYDAVLNSAPLGNMQRMNLRGLNLNWGTKQAIRSLGYGASCKVGIRFKTLWWIERGISQGGVSKTDQPIRNCVYPSYNINDPVDQPGVLLASYTWSQEAQRIGTLINNNSADGEAELKALLIDNLAQLHSSSKEEYNEVKGIIESNYETHYAYDWYSDPGTTGAFAYFGPGQFKNMYPYIVRNDGTHIIIGEASSAHHAWVVGALESAVRGVYQFLYRHSKHDAKANEVLQAYNRDEVRPPFGPVPAEFDRTQDVVPLGVAHPEREKDVCATGEWLRQGVLAEEIRLKQGGDRLDPAKVERKEVTEFLAVKGEV
ncbi:MAG: hypothetical protein Q9207_006403 [Kuettlingeria erythrocarpa]